MQIVVIFWFFLVLHVDILGTSVALEDSSSKNEDAFAV